MTWLLVAFIPALLMLGTFGLDRIESGLIGDSVSPDDVDAVLRRAEADCARLPAHGARDEFDTDQPSSLRLAERLSGEPNLGLPARMYVHHRVNPEFWPTRHADRV